MLQACQTPLDEFIYRFRDGIGSFLQGSCSKWPVRRNSRPSISTFMKNADTENTELLSRIAGGDQKAFAQFYDQFALGLYSLVYKILNDPRETEDVLQE